MLIHITKYCTIIEGIANHRIVLAFLFYNEEENIKICNFLVILNIFNLDIKNNSYQRIPY